MTKVNNLGLPRKHLGHSELGNGDELASALGPVSGHAAGTDNVRLGAA